MKQLVSVSLMITLTFAASSQKLRLNTYAANVFDETFNYNLDVYNYYHGRINGGLQWGTGIEYMVDPSYGLEITYLRQNTIAPTTYRAGAWTYTKTTDFNMTLNYVMLGLNGHLASKSGRLEAYAGVSQGVVISDIKNPVSGASTSSTKFAWSSRAGGNFWIAGNVGIKLQTQFLMSIQATGGDASTAARYLKTIAPIMQFNVGGGLCFKLGK